MTNTTEDLEVFWEIQAKAHIILGRLESLLIREELDSNQLDEITEIIKGANDTISIAKQHIFGPSQDLQLP